MATLWRLAAPTFVPAGFCELLTVLCQVALPLFVRELLYVLQTYPYQKCIPQGMPFAVCIFLVSVINAFANHRHRHLAMKTGIILRAAVITILYEHILELTPRGRLGLTTGEMTNYVAVDTQKLYEVAQEAHLLWALPLSILLVTGCLIWIMGPVTLVGIAILILFVPIVQGITSKMLSIRQERVKMTDLRIGIVNSMLQGIKVTKVNNYEGKYEARVREAREKELAFLCRELAVWASTMFCMVVSPVLATAATLSAYVLVDENNLLTAAQSFSVLLLFAALRFPINYFGRLTSRLAQAISAIERLTKFLRREVRADVHPTSKSDTTDNESSTSSILGEHDAAVPPLDMSHASFCVGGSVDPVDHVVRLSAAVNNAMEPSAEGVGGLSGDGCFTASEFTMSVRKGEVLAVCGPVGSGKSTLIQGIIDEVPAASPRTKVSTRGKIAYVSQSPFILNMTLRDNILFGLPYDEKLYRRVIEACCLRQDIEQIGPSRDLTEIGERGVTLSGGTISMLPSLCVHFNIF